MAEQRQRGNVIVRRRSLHELLGGLQNFQAQVLGGEGGRFLEAFLRPLQAEFLIVVLSLNDPARHQQERSSGP